MTEFQAWFQPLLWVIATITAIVAFIRLCKPVWKIFTAPAEFSKQLSIFSKEMHDKFADMNERMDRQDEDLRILKHAFLNSYFQTGLKGNIDEAVISRGLQNGMNEYVEKYK